MATVTRTVVKGTREPFCFFDQKRTVGDAGPYGILFDPLPPSYGTNGIMLVSVEKM